MTEECIIDACSRRATHECCCRDRVFICNEHVFLHIAGPDIHPIKKIVRQLNCQEKKEATDWIELLEKLRQLKIQEEAAQLEAKSQELLRTLASLSTQCLTQLRSFNQGITSINRGLRSLLDDTQADPLGKQSVAGVFESLLRSESEFFQDQFFECLPAYSQMFSKKGQYVQASVVCDLMIALYRERNDKSRLAQVLRSYGDTLVIRSNYSEAYEAYNESITICKDLGLNTDLAQSLHSLGKLYDSEWRFQEAVSEFDKGIEAATEGTNDTEKAKLLESKGFASQKMRNYPAAAEAFSQASDIYQNLELVGDLARALWRLGLAREYCEEDKLAEIAYEKSIDLYDSIGQNIELGKVLEAMQALQSKIGQAHMAEFYRQRRQHLDPSRKN